jgi:hypothetical protein
MIGDDVDPMNLKSVFQKNVLLFHVFFVVPIAAIVLIGEDCAKMILSPFFRGL